MPWTTPETFTAGQTLTAASMNIVSGNTNALTSARRLGYTERTTSYTADQNNAPASAVNIFTTSISWTAVAATYIVDFYCPSVYCASNGYTVIFACDSSGNGVGRLGVVYSSSGANGVPVYVRRAITYTAGAKTLNARAFYQTTGNGTLTAGDGTGSNDSPMYLALYGPVETT